MKAVTEAVREVTVTAGEAVTEAAREASREAVTETVLRADMDRTVSEEAVMAQIRTATAVTTGAAVTETAGREAVTEAR